ncbi:hypothetical protein GOP47_0028252 [Adiantum capillus-veneris]|nr:hypothetical protein GOP47_0028252 [Adiantum capillus-veneris]
MEPKAFDNVRRLFRECLRRAELEGRKRGNSEVLKEMIRKQFKRNMYETDKQKIEEMRKAAVNGLLNHLLLDTKLADKQAKQSS